MRAWKLILFLIAGLLFGCTSPSPREVQVGSDMCGHCRMVISDKKFAAELVTEKGRIVTFDAVECLKDYLEKNASEKGEAWVYGFDTVRLIPMSKASFVHSPQIRSPMGGQLAAYEQRENAEEFIAQHGGDLLTDRELMALSQKAGGHDHHHHDH